MNLTRTMIFSLALTATLPATAMAQNFSATSSQPPLYPYATGSSSTSTRTYPYVSTYPRTQAQAKAPRRASRPAVVVKEPALSPAERAVAEDRIARRSKVGPTRHDLVQELQRARKGRTVVINEKPVRVYDRPRVIERRHIVDVPVVVERRRYVDHYPVDQRPEDDDVRTQALPPAQPQIIQVPQRRQRVSHSGEGATRVIRADAEIRITGDDQMSIKLYRKGRGASASAE